MDRPKGSSSKSTPGGITDSPLFWLCLFAGVGLVAVLAVAPKFAVRQGRLEQRYENRLRTLEHQGVATRSAPRTEPAPPQTNPRPRNTLLPLALLLAAVFLITAVALMMGNRRAAGGANADREVASTPHGAGQPPHEAA